MESKTEYTAGAANPRNCYSSIVAYGANGEVNPIVNPSPATVVPQLFWRIQPNRAPNYTTASTQDIWYARNCRPYSTLNGIGNC